jgi:hypothetical protein
MTALVRRLLCRFTGHPDTLAWWGTTRRTGDGQFTRKVEERCCRCACVVTVATARLVGERWVS